MEKYTGPIIALILLALVANTTAYGYQITKEFGNLQISSSVPTYSIWEEAKPKEIRASEILDKIKKGQPVEYNNIIVKGNLSLNQLDLPMAKFEREPYYHPPRTDGLFTYYTIEPEYRDNVSVVSSLISIQNSIIEGNADLGNTIFMELVNFANTNFKGTTNFKYSLFIGDAYFWGCQFDKNAGFSWSQFCKGADFSDSRFNEQAYFSGSKMYEDAYFGFSNFNRGADFSSFKFDLDAIFTNSKFNGTTSFGSTSFGGNACFNESLFNESASFRDSKFSKDAHFGSSYGLFLSSRSAGLGGSTFIKDADFSGSEFKKECNFRFSKVGGDANFFGSQFNKGADFQGSQINGYADFEGAKFLGYLCLTHAKISRLNIFWLNVNHLICDDGPTYLALIKTFRDLEQYGASDDIYYQYRDWRLSQRPWSDWNKYLDILAWISCGYGVRWHHSIYSGIFVLIFFGLVYALIIIGLDPDKANYLFKIKESFWFSVIVLLSAPKELYPLEGERYEYYAKHVKYLPILERIIGWGLLLLFIGTLSRVMIRY